MSDLSQPLKTWSHLTANRRRPTEYEVVSTKNLWNTPNHRLNWRFAGSSPQIQWIIKNRNNSKIQHPDWDAFRDPDQMVYRTYTMMQDGQEAYVDGILNDYDRNGHDEGLDAGWVETLRTHYAPARYLVHAVQMAISYLIALSPCGPIANGFMLQGGDQLRWVSRIAYRTVELGNAHPQSGFGKTERELWETGPGWAGFIELAEKTLVAWDWGECFFATSFILKPAIDEAFMRQFAEAARDAGDTLTAALLDAQFADSRRARRFAAALLKFLLEGRPENAGVFDVWTRHYVPLADRAIAGFTRHLDPSGKAAAAAQSAAAAFRREFGLSR